MPSERSEWAAPAASMADDLPDPDPSFLADNLLTADDFNLGINFEVEVDPNEYLLDSDVDILKHFADELEIPMDEDVVNLNNFFFNEERMECAKKANNSFDNIYTIKQEPHSPEQSSPSPQGSDSSTEMWQIHAGDATVELRQLETPPITPQSSVDGSPPSTPINHDTNNAIQGLLTTAPQIRPAPTVTMLNTMNCNTTLKSQRSHSKSILPSTEKQNLVKAAAPSQFLVLTPEEYAKLGTYQPILRLDVPVDTTVNGTCNGADANVVNTVVKTELSSKTPIKTTQKNVINAALSTLKPLAALPTSDVKQELDVNALKRQQRMIKNRASACLSRMKKKEYLSSLENQVKEIMQKNQQLQQDNCQLRQRVSELERENQEMKKVFNVSRIKKTTAVLAIIFLFGLNILPLRGIFENKHTSAQTDSTFAHHHSRTLLWDEKSSSIDWINDANVTNAKNNSVTSNCPLYINKTESQRLDSELRGWVFGSKKNKNTHSSKTRRRKTVPTVPRLYSLIVPAGSNVEAKDYKDVNNNELQLYNIEGQFDDGFLKAFQRRNDTFYVVSLEPLLFPALTHNKTQPPLMSLVLPAIPFNNETGEPIKDHVAMMQIDCGVTNTKLMYVKKSLIPHHRKNNDKNDTFFRPDSSQDKDEQNQIELSQVNRKEKKSLKPKILPQNKVQN